MEANKRRLIRRTPPYLKLVKVWYYCAAYGKRLNWFQRLAVRYFCWYTNRPRIF